MTAGSLAVSLGAHLALLAAMRWSAPPLEPEADPLVELQRYDVSGLYIAEAEREAPPSQELGSADLIGQGDRDTAGRYGVAGPPDNADPHISRERAPQSEAHQLMRVGPLSGDPKAPSAPSARDDALGTDPLSAVGRMRGELIEDSAAIEGHAQLTGWGDAVDASPANVAVGRSHRCRLP